MANFLRVIRLSLWFVLGVVLVGVPMLSYASDTEIQATYGATYYPGVALGYWAANRSAATAEQTCADFGKINGASPAGTVGSKVLPSGVVYGFVVVGVCQSSTSSETTPLQANMGCASGQSRSLPNGSDDPKGCHSIGSSYSCPSSQNWTLNGSVCQRPACVAPQTRNASTGLCDAPACDPGTSKIGTGKECISDTCPDGSARASNGLCRGTACDSVHNSEYSSQPPTLDSSESTVCSSQGCSISIWKNSAGSTTRRVAGTCDPAVPIDPDACPSGTVKQTIGATTKCYPTTGTCASKGMCSGSVNNVTVCVACSPDTKTTPPGTTTDKKSTTVDPVTGEPKTVSETKTVEQTVTTDSNGQKIVKTTTTTVNPDGTTTKEETTASEASYCEANPNATMCKNSLFGGSCGSPPTCDGDAVQCAQANAAFEMNCNLKTEPNDAAYMLGKTISSGGADPLGNPLSASNTVSTDIAGIVSAAGGQRSLSASCIASPSFSVMGRSFTFDTTNFCRFAQIVGYLMVAASSVIAVRMVASGNT